MAGGSGGGGHDMAQTGVPKSDNVKQARDKLA